MKKVLITSMILALSAGFASAAVSVLPQAGYFYADSAGTTLLPTNSLVAFIADVEGDGFGDLSKLGTDGFTVDDDDVLLGIGSSGEVAAGFVSNTIVWPNIDSSIEGKSFAMLFFAAPYSADATGAAEGTAYGVFIPELVVPNDGVNAAFSNEHWLSQSLGGNYEDSMFLASNVTVPEPTTMALLGLGGLLAVRRRRNA